MLQLPLGIADPQPPHHPLIPFQVSGLPQQNPAGLFQSGRRVLWKLRLPFRLAAERRFLMLYNQLRKASAAKSYSSGEALEQRF